MTALIIKTLFSSDNYHETLNINTSQVAMLLYRATTVPHPQSTLRTYRVTAENNMAAWKRSTCIDRSCCGGIITGRFVSLLIKKINISRTKSKTPVDK